MEFIGLANERLKYLTLRRQWRTRRFPENRIVRSIFAARDRARGEATKGEKDSFAGEATAGMVSAYICGATAFQGRRRGFQFYELLSTDRSHTICAVDGDRLEKGRKGEREKGRRTMMRKRVGKPRLEPNGSAKLTMIYENRRPIFHSINIALYVP